MSRQVMNNYALGIILGQCCEVIAASDSDISRLRTTAAIIPHGDKQNDLSIAAVNSSNEERTVTLNVPNVIEKASLNQYL